MSHTTHRDAGKLNKGKSGVYKSGILIKPLRDLTTEDANTIGQYSPGSEITINDIRYVVTSRELHSGANKSNVSLYVDVEGLYPNDSHRRYTSGRNEK